MTPAERFWLKVRRRTATLQPEVAASLLRAFAILRESLPPRDLASLIARGDVEGAIRLALSDAILDRAFIPFRTELRRTVEQGFRTTLADVPKAGKIDGVLAVTFDYLAPNVVTAVRALDTRVMTALKDDVRETVRAFIENGLRDGRASLSVAREIRGMIGLGETQLGYVANLRAELETGKYADAARRALIDRRFNLAKLDALSPAERAGRIDTIVEAYRKAWITQNAATISHTATMDAYRAGQHLSWKEAQANGVIPEGFRLMKTWEQIDRPTKRDEHVPLQGETVPFDEPYSNGQMIPGETDYNCGCLSRVFVARTAA
jgi:hypothetical protein